MTRPTDSKRTGKIDKGYKKYILYKKSIPVIYGWTEQNIYGTMDVLKGYYDIFLNYLIEELEYKLNPYDQCIAGKMINNKKKDKVKFTIHGYIHLLVGELPTDMTEKSVLPTKKKLSILNIQEDQDRIHLSPEEMVNLHNLRAKLLFRLKQMKPDLQVAVSFLCTPVRDPDTND